MGAARRDLPSGTVVVGIRLVVERDPRTLRGRTARIDAIDCVAWDPACQSLIAGWSPGDVVEVAGALRRRFRRTESGPVSRYEVEVVEARLISPPTAPVTASSPISAPGPATAAGNECAGPAG
jgi:single-strand DNA-binding protein